MTITLNVESDEPVLVLVVPLRKTAPRPTPADSRRTITTTAEPVDNVLPFRRAVGA